VADNALTRLLSPAALARLKNLEYNARQRVEGAITGRHKSPYKGFSVEFAEHRQYVAGDDIKDLDWRVLGKSDRYYIKQYEEETNLRSYLLLDASGSMKYAGEARTSKFEYARGLAACMAYLLLHQQDAVGLFTYDKAVRKYIPPRTAANHLLNVLEEIERTVPGGETGLSPIWHDVAERIRRRGVVLIISDLFDDPKDLAGALQHLRYRRHEVVIFHVMAAEELEFPFRQWSQFVDLEAPANKIMVEPLQIRDEYLRQVRMFLDEIKQVCGSMTIDYVPMSTAEPYDKALAFYLGKRAAFKKR
jgi:uncharacterized protein (DUF58 family)